MEIDKIFNSLKTSLEKEFEIQEDKPEETLEATIKALWFKAAGTPISSGLAGVKPLPQLNEEALEELHKLLKRRLGGVPLAHITGRQNFMGIEFLTDKRALIPRKETEILGNKALELAESLLKQKHKLSIFDLCCGSGNLGLALATKLENVQVIGSDLSPEAVELSRENMAFLGLNEQVQFYQSDLFAAFESEKYYAKTDLIVCNPPYISSNKVLKMKSEISGFEPSMAFDGGMMGFKIIQKLIQEAPRFLSNEAWLLFEVGVGQGPFIYQLCEKSKQFDQLGTVADSGNNIRVIFAAKRNS